VSQKITFVCDFCGKTTVESGFPYQWRTLCTDDRYAPALIADVCSKDCAGAWAARAFEESQTP